MRDILGHIMQHPNFNQVHEQTVKQIIEFPEINAFIRAHETQLSPEMILNSMSKLNEFMREVKAQQAGKTGINPGYQPYLFINQNFIDVMYKETEAHRIQAEKIRRERLIDNRMMSPDVRQASLQEIINDTPSRKNALGAVLDFIQAYQEDPRQAQGLYLTGPFGTGKTFLLGALANYLVSQDVAVTMIHYPTYANHMKDTMHDHRTQLEVNEIKHKPILMIDDIGAESNNAWLRDDILGVILEYRMKEQLPTFFTSNFTMEELTQHLATTKNSSDLTKASRLMERIYYLAKEVVVDGPNKRRSQR